MSLRAFLLTLGYGIKEMKEIAGKAPRFDKTLPEIACQFVDLVIAGDWPCTRGSATSARSCASRER